MKLVSKPGSTRRKVGVVAGSLVAALTIALVPQTGASAAGCGLLGLFNCTAPTAAPGTPVAQLNQVNQSNQGGTNPKLGNVPSTATIGVPNQGTVPVVGPASTRAADGAYVAYETRVDARTLDLMVYSPALGGPAPVRLILPATYTTNPTATFPSLWLLHGGNDKGDYQSWSLYSTVPQDTVGLNAFVVMPSIGTNAFATNWWNYGLGGNNQYDTFVSTELPQLLQRGYRANTKMAIGGVSSGGFSALSLAALHPGLYGAAASYSGLIDTSSPITAAEIVAGQFLSFQIPYSMWGSYLLTNSIWSSRNPAAQAAKLRTTSVFVSAGNGNLGPLDPRGRQLGLPRADDPGRVDDVRTEGPGRRRSAHHGLLRQRHPQLALLEP